MSTFNYVRNVKPENVRVVAQQGALTITVTGENYTLNSLELTGDDIVGIARALANIIVKPKPELATV